MALRPNAQVRQTLLSLWWAGVTAVAGDKVVANALQRDASFSPDLIIAVGKAAASMCQGAISTVPDFGAAIVVTKYGHAVDSLSKIPGVRVIEAGHPQPDENSLVAGEAILSAVRTQESDAKLLLLISGGASSLVEVLPSGVSLKFLQDQTRSMLAAGLAIDAINRERRKLSQLKGGKLLQQFSGSEVRVYAISDVQGDAIEVIGSGLGDIALATFKSSEKVVGSNALARAQIELAAVAAGWKVRRNEETLYGDVFDRALSLACILKNGETGVYIWGGEPTIVLPAEPGDGGRNQSLALAIAKEIRGCDGITVLVAGTDGTDGPTVAAGSFAEGNTFDDIDRATTALSKANAGQYLQARGDRLHTGPTNTNVMDIVVALDNSH
jgi:hydroxypyruvate reductase